MKLSYKEMQKAMDYIAKNSDKAFLDIDSGPAIYPREGLRIKFTNNSGDDVEIFMPLDEQAFSKITKTERF